MRQVVQLIQAVLGLCLIAFALALLWLHVAQPIDDAWLDYVVATPFVVTGFASLWSACQR